MVRDNNQCQIEGFIYKQWKERPEEVGPMEELHTKVYIMGKYYLLI